MTEKSKKKSLHPGWVVLIVFVCLALALAVGLALWRKLSPETFSKAYFSANTLRKYYSPSTIKRRRELKDIPWGPVLPYIPPAVSPVKEEGVRVYHASDGRGFVPENIHDAFPTGLDDATVHSRKPSRWITVDGKLVELKQAPGRKFFTNS